MMRLNRERHKAGTDSGNGPISNFVIVQTKGETDGMIMDKLHLQDKKVESHNDKRMWEAQTGSSNFKEKLALASASQSEEVNVVPLNGEMSLEEYKKQIYLQLSEMSVHPALGRTEISVQISEKAFERMKGDPAYEEQMLELIDRDLNEGWHIGMAPAYIMVQVGENESDYRATSMGSAYKDTYEQKSKNSFWERRKIRAQELKEYEQKRAEKLATLRIRAIKAANMANQRNGGKDRTISSTVSAAELLAGLT